MITIDTGGSGNGNAFAGITVGAGNPAIRVTGAVGGNVLVVRGLTMDGQTQAGSDGIDYTGSGRLHVENVSASNFSGSGVLFQGGAGSPQLYIRDSSFRNNGNSGVRVASTAAANAFIENVKADGNNAGLAVVNAGS
ncbi:MAG: right-handed parallel beta-helix repeat-containing protein, partial [Acidobacteria bacterium]|nr:right-handed parallel beta-helix repeat-containing protein [Acidobacteriota bacterium]